MQIGEIAVFDIGYWQTTNQCRHFTPSQFKFMQWSPLMRWKGRQLVLSLCSRVNVDRLPIEIDIAGQELNFTEMYKLDSTFRYGFQFEEHKFHTGDGFLLHMHRIYKKEFQQSKSNNNHLFEPIILQHGLFQSSGIFITNEEKSLAFYLASQGYDVWMGNARCVFEGHKNFTPNDFEYWNWSMDELAKYDFPGQYSILSLDSSKNKYFQKSKRKLPK